jgi:lysophospholipase L1-like esterase
MRHAKPAKWMTSLWIGDSYTADYVATDTAALLGWARRVDGEGGTGFVANGHDVKPRFDPLPVRLPKDVVFDPNPKVVVIDAGRNDWRVPPDQFRQTVTLYFDALAADYPSSRIVVVAPYEMNPETSPDFSAMRAILGQQAQAHDWAFVDPLAADWINAYSAKLTISDGVHPSQKSTWYIAYHLAPAIGSLLRVCRRASLGAYRMAQCQI